MLALRYRPQILDDLVGQVAATTILRQMLVKRQLPGALLLAGPRGSGKTSSARIVSADLNCTGFGPMETIENPCGVCPSCKDVFNGSSLVALEVDAASRGNVDDIRSIISLVQYELPNAFRVVLIDECHNLSRDAWNALLKTLEEPPARLLFILVTTEEERVPDTILSRAMRVPFSKVSVADIASRLTYVCQQEHIEFEQVAIEEISRVVDGGMRDALMLLEQLQITGGSITLRAYHDLFGADDTDFYLELDKSIALGRVADADAAIIQKLRTVADPTVLIDNWGEVERKVLLSLVGQDQSLSPDQLKWHSVKAVLGRMVALWEIRSRVRYLGLRGQTLLKLTVLIMAGKRVETPELALDSLEDLAQILN